MLNKIINSLQPPAIAFKAKPVQFAKTASAESGKQAAMVDLQQLQTTASKLSNYFQNLQRTLSFSVAEDGKSIVIEVYDSETQELIRQIPAEQSIKLAAFMEDQSPSLLLDEHA